MFRTFTDVTRPAFVEEVPTYQNRVYICDFCSEGWSSETEVEIHRSSSHGSVIADMMKNREKAICKMCMTEFADQNILLRHIKAEHLLSSETAIRVERDIFICDYCGDLFFNKLLLIHHILTSHAPKNKNYTMKCPRCYMRIRINTCWYHFLKHKLQSVAICKICLNKSKDRLTLAEHLKSHPCIYKCDTCLYITKKKELFDVHIHNVHKRPEICVDAIKNKWKKYYMPMKYSKTWQRINLMGWKGVRLTNNIHICILCREICVGVASMKQHIMVDHMTPHATDEKQGKTKYECSCGLSFTYKVLYKHHMLKFKEEHDF